MRWLKFTQENPLKINWNNEEQAEGMGEAKETVIDTNKEEKSLEEQADQNQTETAENLEAVKRIWREMTKEEKTDAPPVQYGKQGGKRNYNKRDDMGGNWSEKNLICAYNTQAFYKDDDDEQVLSSSTSSAETLTDTTNKLVKSYWEMWDYQGGCRFRGFVAEGEEETSMFVFF